MDEVYILTKRQGAIRFRAYYVLTPPREERAIVLTNKREVDALISDLLEIRDELPEGILNDDQD